MSEQVKAVDNRAEALRHLASADAAVEHLGLAEDPASWYPLACAGIHAQLALVDEVAKLREQLESGAIEVMYGGETA